ncbi:MAG TPA: GLUG motif-containing protein [Sedimentisphaerales bacterium]|nr:GLUG motif-containing protein [Sedimentisphaerales bacterium]
MTKAGNSQITRTITLLITIFSLSLPAYAQYGGGTGEPNDPYLIYTAEQMNEIGLNQEDWGKHFKLMADIDLGSFTGTSYNIIGGEWDNPFTGVFDGNNKKISNFNYSSIGRYKVGIFGYIYESNAEVKDLGLIDPNIDAREGDIVGSLVGYLRNGAIINCYAQGGSVSGYDGVGGLVGLSFESTITNCYATTSVSGNKDIGGLTGNAGIITNCYATGDVSGYENVGGLVGRNYEMIINCYSMSNVSGQGSVGGLVGDNMWGKITNCYSSASTTGTYFVGGLVGANTWGTITNCYSSAFATGTYYVGGLVGDGGTGTITNCYSSASVTGSNSVGGLVGTNEWGKITNCYSIGQVDGMFNVGGLVGYIAGNVSASFWDTQTSGQAISAGGTGLTTTEMNDPNTFINAGWDFFGPSDSPSYIWIWAEPESGGYPILWWQLPPNYGLPAFSGGTGEPNNPYLISTANELNSIGYNPRLMDAHFKLINDIDLTGVDLFSIGANLYPFTGTLDGNGKKISNLGGTQGLFENVRGEHAHIKDLGLIDPNIDAGIGNGGGVGPLVGTIRNGTIINCYAQGGSVSGGVRIGGLVGDNSSSIASCYSSASVSGAFSIGGLVGTNIRGTITNCYAKGSVSISHMGAGGLVGQNYAGTIENCYSVGHVQGPNDVGGLIGSTLEDGTVITSFWDTQTSGQTSSAGGIPLKTNEMQTASIFLTVGWDFVDEDQNGTEDIWWVLEGQDYPRLWWEADNN